MLQEHRRRIAPRAHPRAQHRREPDDLLGTLELGTARQVRARELRVACERFYERETGFYEHIASQVQLRTPRCYFNAFKPDNGDFLLLLEDLSPATVGEENT